MAGGSSGCRMVGIIFVIREFEQLSELLVFWGDVPQTQGPRNMTKRLFSNSQLGRPSSWFSAFFTR